MIIFAYYSMYESYFHFVLFGRITFVLLCDGVRACVFLSFVHTRAISLYWDILRLALCWCIAALGETGITASASIVIHVSFDGVFFFVCHFALLLSFWFHTRTFCRYVYIIGGGADVWVCFCHLGCVLCVFSHFSVLSLFRLRWYRTCMWTTHIRAHVCSLKFVSTRNMVLTFAHIQPFKSAQYVILILTSHSRIIFHLFSALWMDFMPGCFYERTYVFVFHFDGRTNQFQVFDFRCCALCSVLYHICV